MICEGPSLFHFCFILTGGIICVWNFTNQKVSRTLEDNGPERRYFVKDFLSLIHATAGLSHDDHFSLLIDGLQSEHDNIKGPHEYKYSMYISSVISSSVFPVVLDTAQQERSLLLNNEV